MRRTWFVPTLCAIVAAAAPVLAVSEPTQEELQVNRRLLERWRADPEHYARLKRDYKAFQALPAEKRDRLRDLDRDLREEDVSTQAKLLRVLDRYAAWLDRLPDLDRARIEAAPDGAERLRVVKELREREWIEQLPRADQKRIEATPADLQPKLIADLRQEERARRREWQLALWNVEDHAPPGGNPTKAGEFPSETRFYLNATLNPMLTNPERQRLKDTEGKWPEYARLVWEFSQKHEPVRFPPSAKPPPVGPVDYKSGEIPEEFVRLLAKAPRELYGAERRFSARLHQARGKYPDFPLALLEVAREKNIIIKKPLGPCTLEDFHKLVRDFYFDKMVPVLQKSNPDELEKLKKTSGSWPDYPNLFMDLAHKHKLQVPGTYIGGTKALWDAARADPQAGTNHP